MQSNPYIEEGGFEILDVIENSAKFQITVFEDNDNSFDPSSPLEVTLNDSEGNTFNTMATYIEEESSGNNYVYEITELNEGTNYEIISLNNTGLAIYSNIDEIDNEILISDDLSSEGSFTTLYDNPYIDEDGFEILDVTENSVKFQITVFEDADNSFDPSFPLEITLKDSEGNIFNTTASYIEEESSSDNYVYEITELEEGTNYEIISLNNTGLAISNNSNEIDDEILISDDLSSEGSFTTLYDNPYIEEGTESGFEIIDYTDTTVTYTITVYNGKPNENIDVSLIINENSLATSKKNENNLLETKTYSSHLINSDEANNKYTYEITGLDDNVNYTFYSLDNSGLAIGSNDLEVDDQIILIDDLNIDSNLLSFKTDETKIPNYVWIIVIIILIVIIFIGILLLLKILHKNNEKKMDREINNLADEEINKKVQKSKKTRNKNPAHKKQKKQTKNKFSY